MCCSSCQFSTIKILRLSGQFIFNFRGPQNYHSNSTMSTLAAPVRVSPVIKFFRWSLLGTGVVYGAFHQNRLGKKEAALREVEAKQKVVRDAKLAAEKKIAADREMMELEAMAK